MSVLSEIEAAFLAESDALAGVRGVDYRDPNLQRDEGHAGAWLLLKQMAQTRTPLTRDDLSRVQALLRETSGDPRATPNDTQATPADIQATPADALAALIDELASRVGESGPARDFHGGHTFALAGSFLQRLLALEDDDNTCVDGRLARLLTNYLLVHRKWSIVIFRAEDRARLEAERHSAVLLGAYLVEKVREHVDCGHCRVGQVTRTQVGLSTDSYKCDDCGAEFKLDWKGLQNAYKTAIEPAAEAEPPAKSPSRFTLRAR